jgi:chromosome segregation ATPase
VPNLKQKEKEDALNRILQLERQVDEKQKLELDIEQLKGKLEVVKHMAGEGVDVKKRSEELTAELNERIEEMEDLEALNQTLVVKHRMTNDEIQDAKKELITVTPYASIYILENLQKHTLGGVWHCSFII